MSNSTTKQVKRRKSEAGEPAEADVIRILRLEGIYAAPGKASEWLWVDVVAWGCVRIEVKSATQQKNGKWVFNFTNQKGKGIKGDLVVLVLIDGDTRTHHVFPATHPIFYRNGKLKSRVDYNPMVGTRHYRWSLTPSVMLDHQNAWHLIEEQRKRIIAQLSEGERFKPGRVQEPAPPMQKLL